MLRRWKDTDVDVNLPRRKLFILIPIEFTSCQSLLIFEESLYRKVCNIRRYNMATKEQGLSQKHPAVELRRVAVKRNLGSFSRISRVPGNRQIATVVWVWYMGKARSSVRALSDDMRKMVTRLSYRRLSSGPGRERWRNWKRSIIYASGENYPL